MPIVQPSHTGNRHAGGRYGKQKEWKNSQILQPARVKIVPATRRFWRSASATCPCESASTARVPPHPGQRKPVNMRNGHSGRENTILAPPPFQKSQTNRNPSQIPTAIQRFPPGVSSSHALCFVLNFIPIGFCRLFCLVFPIFVILHIL